MVRLLRATHATLRRLEAGWIAAAEHCDNLPEADDRSRIGLDRIIRTLIARELAHRRRRTLGIARSRQRRTLNETKDTQPPDKA
jgi:hypothetical protein